MGTKEKPKKTMDHEAKRERLLGKKKGFLYPNHSSGSFRG